MKKYLYIVFILIGGIIFAQDEQNDDPKVGLVLSGGGAKGLAHIGALKVIEETGVRIDYIGGTSMGAIIGALYASGYSAIQLDSIFNTLDFETLIQDDLPRSAKTFFEKNESERYAITLPFDNFHVSFPSGLSKGQNVYNLLSRLTAHVSHIERFADLPIPFFCVATDVETGEEIVLREGYLPRAIKASGALPSLFSPVVVDGKVLIDGGVTNNYPIDEVRGMGADIVIGVDVQDSLRDRERLKSAFELLLQINNFRTIGDMAEKKSRTDIYIHPDIKDYTVVSFDQGNSIIAAGKEKALSFKDHLEALANRQKKGEARGLTSKPPDDVMINQVEIFGNEKYTRAYVLGKLKLKIPALVSYEDFNEGVNNLSATGNFQDIDYRFVADDNGGFTVEFDLIENEATTVLRLGAHYDDLLKTAALINVTRKRVITNNDIVSFDFGVGDNLRYNFNYYIDKGFYWSVGLNSSFDFFDKNVAIDFIGPDTNSEAMSQINKINLEYGDLTNQLYVETLFRRTFLLGMGTEHKWLRYLTETIGVDANSNPRTVFENTNYFSAFGYLKYDTFDNSFFPESGIYFEGNFHLYLFAHGMNNNFDQFSVSNAKVGYAISVLPQFTTAIYTEGGFKIGGSTTRSFDFFVGGYGFKPINNIVPMFGYEALSLRGDTYLKSTLSLDYEIYKKNHITFSANIANVGDDLFSNGQWIDGIDYTGYALGYGLETFMGPFEIKYSYSPETDEGEWYVTAGFRF